MSNKKGEESVARCSQHLNRQSLEDAFQKSKRTENLVDRRPLNRTETPLVRMWEGLFVLKPHARACVSPFIQRNAVDNRDRLLEFRVGARGIPFRDVSHAALEDRSCRFGDLISRFCTIQNSSLGRLLLRGWLGKKVPLDSIDAISSRVRRCHYCATHLTD